MKYTKVKAYWPGNPKPTTWSNFESNKELNELYKAIHKTGWVKIKKLK